jgi:AcrR family transcriptional regulator
MAEEGQQPAVASRAERAERAILDATRDLLAEGGVRALTVEGVAARSGVAKTTIYRRWRSKNDLALAVLIDVIENVITTPDLDDTRSEALFLVDAAVAMLGSTSLGPIMQGLVSDLATDPELARDYRARVVAARFAEVEQLVRRGVARGDLRPATDHELVCELLFGPVYYRLFLSGAPLDEGLAERTVDAVLRAFAA